MSIETPVRRLDSAAPNLSQVGLDSQIVRDAFGMFPTGVAAISAIVEDEPLVLVASSFQVGISLDPPLVMFAVQHTSTTWPRLQKANRLGVSILADDHHAVARQLASKARAERFEGINVHRAENGAHYLADAALWFECSVHAAHRAGDHDIVVLVVHAVGTAIEPDPLVWHASRFHSLGRKLGS